MIKVIDVDELFDKYISDFVYGNIGKIKPEEIENEIPKLYEKFGDAPLKELGGKTPNTFYKGCAGEELIGCLKEHLKTGVSVPDFLCEAITADDKNESALAKALKEEEEEELVIYLMNMLGEMGSKKAKDVYLEFALYDERESVRELATELLCDMAEEVKESILSHFEDASRERKAGLTEILSNCKGDDRVFDILAKEFALNQDNIPMYANFLAKYGDERAIPLLTAAIENEKIKYSDFEELRFAIEALGGSYDKERDFSSDLTYKKIRKIKNTKVIN